MIQPLDELSFICLLVRQGLSFPKLLDAFCWATPLSIRTPCCRGRGKYVAIGAFHVPLRAKGSAWPSRMLSHSTRAGLLRRGLRLIGRKPGHRAKNMGLIECFHEAIFSSVAGTLRPFIAEEKAMRGPGGYSWPMGPPAYGEGGWNPREVTMEKTRLPSQNRNIPPDRGSCRGNCVHVKCYEGV